MKWKIYKYIKFELIMSYLLSFVSPAKDSVSDLAIWWKDFPTNSAMACGGDSMLTKTFFR